MLSVALLTKEFPPEVYGGAGVHVEYLARELAELAEVEVHCFGNDRSPPGAVKEVIAYQPWARLHGRTAHLAALQALSVNLAMNADLGDVDVVHSHTWYANFGGHLAKLLHGVPHVCTVHSLEPLRPWKEEQLGGGYNVSRFMERTALEHADAVIAVSRAVADDVVRVYPSVDPDRVHVIQNGVDPSDFEPDLRTDVLERCGIEPSRPSVMFLGRITRQKGIDHFLAAAAQLRPDVQVILRAGAADTVELDHEVAASVAAVRESGRTVVWLRDALDRADVVQLLSNATVFCCPSVYEPFGLVNVEAMACGAPVVASALGGMLDIVDDGVTGYLVPVEGDEHKFALALAERINELVDDPDRARAMGAAGRRRVLEAFTWGAAARRTLALYESLVR